MEFTFMDLYQAEMRNIDALNKEIENETITEESANDYTRRMVILFVKEHSAIDYKKYIGPDPDKRMFKINLVIKLLSGFTPKEFMNLFPVSKKFDGSKFGIRDYFSTMNYVKSLPQDKPISMKHIDEFLMEYENPDIDNFLFHMMDVLSDCMKQDTGKDLVEQWFEKEGVELKTVEIHEDANGQKFMIDENGRSVPVKEYKRRPKYIRLVK